MKQKTKSALIILLLVILVALIGISFYGRTFLQTVFPEERSQNNIEITNQKGETNFLEGDTINIRFTEAVGCGSRESCVTGVDGYAVWVNDKLLTTSGTTGYESVYPNYLKIYKLEAGNNQEVEVIMRLSVSGGDGWNYKSGSYKRTKINVNSLPCVLDTGQSIVAQTYQSDSTLNKNSLRYKDAFVKTCSALPPIIVNSFTKTSYTDLNILTKFNNNFDYQVDSKSVMAFFYVVDNSKAQLSLVCDLNKAFNIETNRCEDINAFVTVCQEGVFNPETGTCTLIPKLDYLCPEGSRYDTVQNSCIANVDQVKCNVEGSVYNSDLKVCIYTPNLEGKCLEGSYDKDKNACILTLNTDYLCLKGKLVDINGTKTCQIIPDQTINCLKGFKYDETLNKCVKPYEESKFNILYITIPLILIVLALIVVYSLSKKGKKR